jgi:5-methylcytosine-specific restriction protein B
MKISASALLPYPEREVADASIIEKVNSLWSSSKKFLVLSGPPGTGKTRATEDYVAELHKASLSPIGVEDCRLSHLFPEFRTKVYSTQEIRDVLKAKGVPIVWDLAVLHPQYSYEDLIRGFRAEPSPGSGVVSLVVREGLLGFAARVVAQLDTMNTAEKIHPRCVLILDEINRAPIGQLFGEAIYALDRRGSAVVTPYPLDGLGATLSIPESLLVLGTMNSIDRATSGFDFALRRRFSNIPLISSREPVKKYWESFGGAPTYGLNLFDQLSSLVHEARSEGNVPVSELTLGHSYFLPPKSCASEDARIHWLYTSYVYQMLPTLLDYQEQGLLEFQEAALAMLPLDNKLDTSACSAIPLTSGIEIFKAKLSSNDSPL